MDHNNILLLRPYSEIKWALFTKSSCRALCIKCSLKDIVHRLLENNSGGVDTQSKVGLCFIYNTGNWSSVDI